MELDFEVFCYAVLGLLTFNIVLVWKAWNWAEAQARKQREIILESQKWTS